MDKRNDTWTLTHDLALLYIALAYGTDYQLSEEELESITIALQAWRQDLGRDAAQEVVVEAMAVYLDDGHRQEVLRAMEALKERLSEAERHRVLEEVVQIAEADGVLLNSERSLISSLADVWEMKAAGDRLLAQTTADAAAAPSWTLMHDISLIFLVMAHSTDNELSEPEIAVIIERLGEWEPDLAEEDVRDVLREALQHYADGPDESSLHHSVRNIGNFLPVVQRLVLLDDLMHIAEVDGALNEQKKKMLASLAEAWNVSIRLNGRAAI